MKIIETLKEHSDELGKGVDAVRVKDLEARLDIKLPKDFREFLLELNYAEIFNDPIYGIHPDNEMLDLYSNNKYKEHFNYGFLEIFSNDIDGTIYLRPDTGAIYRDFSQPAAKSFTDFVEEVLQ